MCRSLIPAIVINFPVVLSSFENLIIRPLRMPVALAMWSAARSYPHYRGPIDLRNVGNHLQDYTVSRPVETKISYLEVLIGISFTYIK
jgi:hypothetical protein